MSILSELTSQAEQAEVVEMSAEVAVVGFEANRLKSSRVEETSGIAVRVVKDGRLGFSASSDLSAADKLVTNVLESASYGDPVAIEFPGALPAPTVRTIDDTIVDLPVSRLVEMGQEIVDLLLEVDPEVQVNVELKRGIEQLSLRNQAGADLSFRRSPLSIGIDLARVHGDDVLLLFEQVGATTWDDDYLAPARRLADKLRLAQRAATLRSGRMPVLFTPTGALALALPLITGLDGKAVYRGTSPMADKVGERIFDPKVHVVDDGTLDGRFGSAPYDDEGVPHRTNVLVEQGVVRGFVFDLKTAAQAAVESTGNGSRGLFSAPSPSFTNLTLAAGDTPLADMIAGIDDGLLADIPLGLGQGNIISGAFSNTLGLAYKIERGEIVGRVKDVSIAGNIYELLRDVAAVSQESELLFYNYSLPHILLSDLNVVTKE
ncbi:MAG TPA: TldD/PmbA family protein [Anaerolineae bacterium]|nr:TldD/PmbA family protein [Anaerolineae bacterium]